MSDTQATSEDPWWRRGLLGLHEAVVPASVPEGAQYDLETARAARLGMLSSLGANLLAGAQRGLSPGERARFIAAAGEAPTQAQAILLQGANTGLNRRYREAQIAELTARTRRGADALAAFRAARSGGDSPAPAAGSGTPRAAAAPMDLSGYQPPEGVDRDTDLAVRTVLGEAEDQGPVGMSAVAHVIRNRARQSGLTPEAVVLAANQFEPWNTPAGRQRLLSIDPSSPAYQNALRLVRTAFSDDSQDPTQGATHFFAPAAQAALGRRPPRWAEGQEPLVIGGHNFYRLGYSAPGGGQAAPAPMTPAQTALMQGGAPQPDATPVAAGAPAPAPASPLNAAQAALVAAPDARRPPGANGNSIRNMPPDLAALAEQALANGDMDGYRSIVSAWLTQEPRNVQTVTLGDGPQGTAGVYEVRDGRYIRIGGTPPPASQVTIENRGPQAYEQRRGQQLAEEEAEVRAGGTRARQTIARLGTIERNLETIRTGIGTQAQMTVGQLARRLGVPDGVLQSLGMDAATVASGETIRSAAGQMLIGMIGPGGFPAQAFSNADREMLERAIPGLLNTPEGNRRIIEVFRAAAQRQVEIADAWNEWRRRHGSGAESFDRFQLERLPQIVSTDALAPLLQDAVPLAGPAPAAAATGPGGRGTAEPPPSTLPAPPPGFRIIR